MPFKWEKDYSFDYRLGYVRKGGEWPGITVIQPKSADTYADIFILGGYTTPGEIEKKISWPHKLFDLLKKSGVSARLFVGDTDGYVSFQEMLLLIRDVLLMKPSLVITLSGYNNFRNAAGLGIREDEAETLRRHPFLGQRQLRVVRDVASVAFDPWKESLYLGMGGGAPPAEYWVMHMDMMNKICEDAGIAFRAFLQPCMFSGRHELDGLEREAFELFTYGLEGNHAEKREKLRGYYAQAAELVRERKHIIDLSGLFDGNECAYDDPCRLNDPGTIKLAAAVFNGLLPLLPMTEGSV